MTPDGARRRVRVRARLATAAAALLTTLVCATPASAIVHGNATDCGQTQAAVWRNTTDIDILSDVWSFAAQVGSGWTVSIAMDGGAASDPSSACATALAVTQAHSPEAIKPGSVAEADGWTCTFQDNARDFDHLPAVCDNGPQEVSFAPVLPTLTQRECGKLAMHPRWAKRREHYAWQVTAWGVSPSCGDTLRPVRALARTLRTKHAQYGQKLHSATRKLGTAARWFCRVSGRFGVCVAEGDTSAGWLRTGDYVEWSITERIS